MKWLLLFSIVLLAESQSEPVGKVLVYEIDPGDWIEGESVEATTRGAVAALDRRINPRGSKRARIRPLGEGRIEIAVYGDDDEMVRRIQGLAESAGTLEFRILANERDHGPLIERARREKGRDVRYQGDLRARWVRVAKGEEGSFDYPEIARAKRYRKSDQYYYETIEDYTFMEILVIQDPFDVTGEYIVDARPGIDQSGRRSVLFTLNQRGGRLFGALTSENLPEDAQQTFTRKLGIILDGRLQSAPAIRSAIFRHVEITGDFTRDGVQDLVDILNSGALPVRLNRVEPHRAEKTR